MAFVVDRSMLRLGFPQRCSPRAKFTFRNPCPECVGAQYYTSCPAGTRKECQIPYQYEPKTSVIYLNPDIERAKSQSRMSPWLPESVHPKEVPHKYVISERLKQLAKPNRPPTKNKIEPLFAVRPSALKYNASERIKQLAIPRKDPPVYKVKTPGEVRPEALKYIPSERIKKLAIPVPKYSVEPFIPDEPLVVVAPEALKYEASERIKQLAHPKTLYVDRKQKTVSSDMAEKDIKAMAAHMKNGKSCRTIGKLKTHELHPGALNKNNKIKTEQQVSQQPTLQEPTVQFQVKPEEAPAEPKKTISQQPTIQRPTTQSKGPRKPKKIKTKRQPKVHKPLVQAKLGKSSTEDKGNKTKTKPQLPATVRAALK